MNEPKPIVVATFYKFAHLPDYKEIKQPLLERCLAHNLKGSILLAEEGINATIAGERADVDAVLAALRNDPRLADLEHKESTADFRPFNRMKVRLKKEIVTIRHKAADPTQQVGTYVPPSAWNTLISDPDVILIDARNDFEVEMGSFQGAVNPHTESFGELPEWVDAHLDPQKHKKVAMFCTGGIRCEKATALLLSQGFEEVYHLRGGILKYFEEIPQDESLWEGECFVFDKRVSLTQELEPGEWALCYACQRPLAPADQASPLYEEGISCPYCHAELPPKKKRSFAERQRQINLARERGEL